MPNISMIDKVVQQVYGIDYVVSKYTFLFINQCIHRQTFLIHDQTNPTPLTGLLSSSKECMHITSFV